MVLPMTPQTVRIGSHEIAIKPSEAEDGTFIASVMRGKQADLPFAADDWTDAPIRLGASRTICEAFGITRNNQNLTKIAKTIDDAMR
jgi:hypothetical protein